LVSLFWLLFNYTQMHAPRQSHQNEFERHQNAQRLRGFNQKESPAYQFLCNRYGRSLTRFELLSLAQVAAEQLKIPLDRAARRRRTVLIKWYDENWGVVAPFLDRCIVVLDEFGEAVGADPLKTWRPMA
jgi:hypothetical protein